MNSSHLRNGMGKIDTVFLDMGNTLVHSHPSWVDVYHAILVEIDFSTKLEQVAQAIDSVWGEVIEQDATARYEPTFEAAEAFRRDVEWRIFDLLGLPTDLRESTYERIRERFRAPDYYRLYPDALPTLHELRRRGYTVGIISNWDWHLPELCEGLDLVRHLDFVVTSSRVGQAKPAPAIFHEGLRLAGTTPDRAVHVGDSLYADVRGAEGVGITGILIDREGTVEADGVTKIKSLEELLSLLEQ